MNEVISLLSEQTNEVNNEIAWLVNDLKDAKQLIELLRDSQSLSENKSVHTFTTLILEKLEILENDDISKINKLLTKISNSVNDLMIEQVNKKNARSTKTTTKRRTRKTDKDKIVKIDNNVDNNKEQACGLLFFYCSINIAINL